MCRFILSFGQSESVSDEEVMQLRFDIGRYDADYQSVYGLHHDTNHLYLHFAFNAVSCKSGKMYAEGTSDWCGLRGYVQGLLPRWHIELSVSDGRNNGRNDMER